MNNQNNSTPSHRPNGGKHSPLSDFADNLLRGLDCISDRLSKLFIRKISFEEYLQATGEVIDEKILEIENKEKIKFVGGSCTFNISEDRVLLTAKLELFFQNSAGNWIKKEQKFNVKTDIFNSETQNCELARIANQELKISVDSPERK